MFVANESSIVERQQSLGRHYAEALGDAWITDHARALPGTHKDAIHGWVEPANSYGVRRPYGIHRAVGGDHDAPNQAASIAVAANTANCVRINRELPGAYTG